MSHKEEESGADIPFVRWFSELSNKNADVAGEKGASLAEMYNHKFPIPPGFVITSQSYKYFMEQTGLDKKANDILANLDMENPEKLNEASRKIRALFNSSEMPKALKESILESYDIMGVDRTSLEQAKSSALAILKNASEPPFVAVRSSSTSEELSGQTESYLNIKGNSEVLDKVKGCFSSLFTSDAIRKVVKKGISSNDLQMAVVIQRMVNSDKSGVVLSKCPEDEKEKLIIEAIWGLGEGIASGITSPDRYETNRDMGEFKIEEIKVAEKKVAVARNSSGKNEVVTLTPERANRQVLSTYEIKMLAQFGIQLENHFQMPQDVEFAISGSDIMLVQSKPLISKPEEEKKPKVQEEPVSQPAAEPSPPEQKEVTPALDIPPQFPQEVPILRQEIAQVISETISENIPAVPETPATSPPVDVQSTQPQQEPIQQPAQEISSDELDMEEILLKELSEGDESYVPGNPNSQKSDIPQLNDAIPIDSKLVERTSSSSKGEVKEVEIK